MFLLWNSVAWRLQLRRTRAATGGHLPKREVRVRIT
jgi:hypothetical protein